MFRKQPEESNPRAPYATDFEFCRIFHEDMSALYLLALLLTADHESAEACFVLALEDCQNGPPVFIEWGGSWARRMVIINAIRLCLPSRLETSPKMNGADAGPFGSQGKIDFVFSLPTFERLIFVISGLERYSDQECSLLLGCGRRAVHLARIRALEQIASPFQFHGERLRQSAQAGTEEVEDSNSFVSNAVTEN